jgi:uncharacterized membrane protein (DUF373 family)
MKMLNHESPDAMRPVVPTEHWRARKYLEPVQDLIVLALCAALFIAMVIKLGHLAAVLFAVPTFRRSSRTFFLSWC